MRNVTITLPEDVARQARIWAAEADTSVSQFLGQILTERMERESSCRQAQADFLSRPPVTLRDAAAAYPKRDDLHDRIGQMVDFPTVGAQNSVGMVDLSMAPETLKARSLENGDRLAQPEFHRRYTQNPHLKKVELIGGTVFVPSPVSNYHAELHAELLGWLFVYAKKHPGIKLADNATLILDTDNEVQPDILVRRTGKNGDGCRENEVGVLVGAPSLIVEIAASSASIDLGPKLDAYRRNGVQEYLVYRVLDREADWFELHQGAYRPLPKNAHGKFESRLFPDLEFPF